MLNETRNVDVGRTYASSRRSTCLNLTQQLVVLGIFFFKSPFPALLEREFNRPSVLLARFRIFVTVYACTDERRDRYMTRHRRTQDGGLGLPGA